MQRYDKRPTRENPFNEPDQLFSEASEFYFRNISQ